MKLINFSLISVLVILTFYLLIVGQDVLLPIVIALVFWYLINLVAKSYSRLRIGGNEFARLVLLCTFFVNFCGYVLGDCKADFHEC